MKLETAKKILDDRAENFYGKDSTWLFMEMDKNSKECGYVDETKKVTEAYKTIKKLLTAHANFAIK